MADSMEPTDEQIAACDVIWDCYKALGTDDLSGSTYDRNEFYHPLLVLNRLAHRVSAPAVILAACRSLQAMTPGGDELAMQMRFEAIMDETYESMPTGEPDEYLGGGYMEKV